MNVCRLGQYLLAIALLVSLQGRAQAPKISPTPPPAAPMSSQDVLLLFAGQSSSQKMLLTLNNNRPSELVVDFTLYDLSGTPRILPSLTLVASESRLIDYGAYLRSQNITFPLGYLKVHYQGRSMELGSQLTLYPVETRGALDSPRSLSVDYVTNARYAVAWQRPGSSAVIALTNVSQTPIQVAFALNGDAEQITIAASETVLRKKETPADNASTLLSVDASSTGSIDALRVFGFVSDPIDGPHPVRTYDVATATSQTLSSVGLVTSHDTHVALRNLSASPQIVTPSLAPIGDSSTTPVTLPPVLVPSKSAVEVPISSALIALAGAGKTRATLLLKSTAPQGSFVGAVDQLVYPGLTQDIPFKTGNPRRYMRGIYPLRWEKDYTNNPMIANTSDQTATVRTFVVAGGVTYTFPDTDIKAGQTVTFDVDIIRKNKTPDGSGHVIPATATYGKFHWNPLPGKNTQVGLHGRTEVESLQEARSSSFSCGSTCEYQYWAYPYFATDPFGSYPVPNDPDARETSVHDQFKDTYGNYSQRGMTADGTTITVDDSSILSFSTSNNDMTLVSNTGNQGSTTARYYFTQYDSYVSSTDDGNPDACSEMDDGEEMSPSTNVTPKADNMVVFYDQGITQGNSCDVASFNGAQRNIEYSARSGTTPVTGGLYIQEDYGNHLTANTCGNGAPVASSCQVGTYNSVFNDFLHTSYCSPSPTSCGFSILPTSWENCGPNAPSTFGSPSYVIHWDDIKVNGSSNSLSPGTLIQ